MMKECSKCKEVKPYSDFHKDKSKKDGLRFDCKDCHKQYREENKEKIKQYDKQWRKKNKEKIKQYNEENKEKIKQQTKQYREENKEKIKQLIKQWREENKEKINQYREKNKEKLKQYNKQWEQENKERRKKYKKQYDKQWRKKNKEKIKQYNEENKEKLNQYLKQRIKTDPIFRLSCNIRSSIYKSLKRKGYSKKTRTYKILGLEYEDFYTWLNTEASNGLDFERDDVHVDHVIPVSFGKTEEQILALNHYSNLQLLTSEENKNKSNTYIKQSNLDRVMKHHPNNSLLTKILLNYDYIIF